MQIQRINNSFLKKQLSFCENVRNSIERDKNDIPSLLESNTIIDNNKQINVSPKNGMKKDLKSNEHLRMNKTKSLHKKSIDSNKNEVLEEEKTKGMKKLQKLILDLDIDSSIRFSEMQPNPLDHSVLKKINNDWETNEKDIHPRNDNTRQELDGKNAMIMNNNNTNNVFEQINTVFIDESFSVPIGQSIQHGLANENKNQLFELQTECNQNLLNMKDIEPIEPRTNNNGLSSDTLDEILGDFNIESTIKELHDYCKPHLPRKDVKLNLQHKKLEPKSSEAQINTCSIIELKEQGTKEVKIHKNSASIKELNVKEKEIKKMLTECLSTRNKEKTKMFFDPTAISTRNSTKKNSKRNPVDHVIQNYLKNIIDKPSNAQHMNKKEVYL